ncbi:hypothetical protein O181_089749 [Austropuccinia psidii MF-1]|uniref:Uncharacterized protein n=1 Tax=Austropuccinia psidii MF-1 TaxID=1389203 RepID=A0A9Q3IU42_9BASI|nr:hypothetical protein [Austropuccinia psidii MF-1]
MQSNLKWSGTLKSKKKVELQQICRQLDIDFKLEAIKAELELKIRKRFKDDPKLKQDERFIALDHPNNNDQSPHSDSSFNSSNLNYHRTRSASRTRLDQDSIESDDEISLKNSSRISSPRKSSSSLHKLNPIHHQILESKIIPINQDHLINNKSVLALDSLKSFQAHSNQISAKLLHSTQKFFSSPWNLCLLSVLAELSFVLFSLIPRPNQLNVMNFHQNSWFKLPIHLKTIFYLIFSHLFLKSLWNYLTLTIILPFIVASLMNVPNSRNPKKRLHKADLKPSVFVYCTTRLAIVILINSVFYPSYHYGWKNISSLESWQKSHLDLFNPLTNTFQNIDLIGFDLIQYVGSAFGLAISLHRLISQYT